MQVILYTLISSYLSSSTCSQLYSNVMGVGKTIFGVDENKNLYLCKKDISSMYECEYTTAYPNTNTQDCFNLVFVFVLVYILISKSQDFMVSTTSPVMDFTGSNEDDSTEEDLSEDDSTE